MKRRDFLMQTSFAASGLFLPSLRSTTRHLIFIVNSGSRKKDYYENASIAPNVHRIAREAFVFEEDHCERVASHENAFSELLQGREVTVGYRNYPTILEYIGNGIQVGSIRDIPGIMQRHRPRILLCTNRSHDAGHLSYERYVRSVQRSDR